MISGLLIQHHAEQLNSVSSDIISNNDNPHTGMSEFLPLSVGSSGNRSEGGAELVNKFLHDSRVIVESHPDILQTSILNDESCIASIDTHRWAIFLNIYVSILQGSLLTYTCGCTLWGIALPPLLYFLRIFSDLFGRPFAFLPRPPMLKTIQGVLYASILRCILSLYFFNEIRGIERTPENLDNSLRRSVMLSVFQV